MIDDKISLLLTCRYESFAAEVQKDIYSEFYRYVYRFIIYVTNDHAATEDIIQESFLKVIKHVPGITNEHAFMSWIRVVVKNTAYSYLRKIKKYRDDLDSDSVYIDNSLNFATDLDHVPKEVELKFIREAISQYLLDMKPEYRVIIEMRWKLGLSYKEIAEHLDTTDQIIKHKLHRARESIRKRFLLEWGLDR